LIDMGIKPYLIPPTLHLAIAQRLIRRLCDKCKKKIKPKPEIKDLILKQIENLPLSLKKNLKATDSLTVFTSVGCKECNNTGFSGRIALYEVLTMTDSLAETILKEPSEAKITEEGKRQGMITMTQDGVLKILKGITTIEEVLRVAEET